MRVESNSSVDLNRVVVPNSISPAAANEIQHTTSSEPPSKRARLEGNVASSSLEPPATSPAAPYSNANSSSSQAPEHQATRLVISNTATKIEGGTSSVITNSPGVYNLSGSSSAESLNHVAIAGATHRPAPNLAAATKMDPLKATTMDHLGTKYLGELQYMLIEFRKLERQLLGAKGAAQIEESAGSRERREKLHSFILHLEDTIRQIEEGCKLEAEGKSFVDVANSQSSQIAESSALTNMTKEKEAEDSVQKLEEHILANLLPVKVRLKKQLAAQQGATRNPVGMPVPRRGSLTAAAAPGGKGTFAAAAELRRKQAEAARLGAQEQEQNTRHVSDPTQFGSQLKGGGSSLTRNLHGTTLGSKQRTYGHGVGAPEKPEDEVPNNRILYAGMVPGSTQHKSGVAAATGVHDMVIENPSLIPEVAQHYEQISETTILSGVSVPLATIQEVAPVKPVPEVKLGPIPKVAPPPTAQPGTVVITAPYQPKKENETVDKTKLSEEERRKLRKKRRKRKLLRIAKRRERDRQRQVALNQQAHATHSSLKVPGGARKKTVLGKGQGRKKGPRAVEYICAQCNDPYNSTCDYNPWWALAQQECPKCRKVQIPRIDITAPANSIEYHPALLAHAEDNGGVAGVAANVGVQYLPKPAPPIPPVHLTKPATSTFQDISTIGSDSDSDLSELSDGSLTDCSMDSDDSDLDLLSLTPAEQAEHETFGHEYKGPKLSDNHTSRLVVLMQHASTCPCRHKSARHRDVCRSTKYMMLHVRDCPGTTSTFDVCPFPWCRKVKHVLSHLVSCQHPSKCAICSPKDLSKSLQALVGLNNFRTRRYRERLLNSAKKAAAARQAALPSAQKGKKAIPQPTYLRPKAGAVPNIPKQGPVSYLKFPPKGSQSIATIHKTTKTNSPPTPRMPTATIKKSTPSDPVRHPWSAVQQTKAPPLRPATYQPVPAPPPKQSQAVKMPPATKAQQPVIQRTPVVPSPAAAAHQSIEDPLRPKAGQSVSHGAETTSTTTLIAASQTALASSHALPPVATTVAPQPVVQPTSASPPTAVGKTQQSVVAPKVEYISPTVVVPPPAVTMAPPQATSASQPSALPPPQATAVVQQPHASPPSAHKSQVVHPTPTSSPATTTAAPQAVVAAAPQPMTADPVAHKPSAAKLTSTSPPAATAATPQVVATVAPQPMTAYTTPVVQPTSTLSHSPATTAPPAKGAPQPMAAALAAPLAHQTPPVTALSTPAVTKAPETTVAPPVVSKPPLAEPSPALPSSTPTMLRPTAPVPQVVPKPASVQPSPSVPAQQTATPPVKSPAAPSVPAVKMTSQPVAEQRAQTATAPSVATAVSTVGLPTLNTQPMSAKVKTVLTPVAAPAAPQIKVESDEAVPPPTAHEPVRHQVKPGKVGKTVDVVKVGG